MNEVSQVQHIDIAEVERSIAARPTLPSSQIAVQQARLVGAITGITDVVEDLENRLEPILRAPEIKPCTVDEDPDLVPLARRMWEQSKRAERLGEFLTELLDRLDL